MVFQIYQIKVVYTRWIRPVFMLLSQTCEILLTSYLTILPLLLLCFYVHLFQISFAGTLIAGKLLT